LNNRTLSHTPIYILNVDTRLKNKYWIKCPLPDTLYFNSVCIQQTEEWILNNKPWPDTSNLSFWCRYQTKEWILYDRPLPGTPIYTFDVNSRPKNEYWIICPYLIPSIYTLCFYFNSVCIQQTEEWILNNRPWPDTSNLSFWCWYQT
jgi:hypothetical protein